MCVVIDVKFAPVMSVPKPYVTVALHHNIDLQCHIQANPLPDIIWLHKGAQIFNNNCYRFNFLCNF